MGVAPGAVGVIKALGRTGDGRPLLVLGLDVDNITRMMANEPVTFDLAELGLPACQVMLVAGRTEAVIVSKLAAHGLIDTT